MKTDTARKVTFLTALGGAGAMLLALVLKRWFERSESPGGVARGGGTSSRRNEQPAARKPAGIPYPPAVSHAGSPPRHIAATRRTVPRREYYHHGDR
jgi:hypothetical protein